MNLPFASPSNIAVRGNSANATAQDLILHANSGVVGGGDTTTLTVERSTIEASIAGASLDSGAIVVRNSLIDLGNNAGAVGVQPANFNHNFTPVDATLDGVTIVGGGANSTGVQAQADSDTTPPVDVNDNINDGETATATIRTR